MPITKSAHKALRQSKTRRARNSRRTTTYKSTLKELKKLITNGQMDEAKKVLSKAYKAIDKTAKTGVIKPNKAARLKSGASKLFPKQ